MRKEEFDPGDDFHEYQVKEEKDLIFPFSNCFMTWYYDQAKRNGATILIEIK